MIISETTSRNVRKGKAGCWSIHTFPAVYQGGNLATPVAEAICRETVSSSYYRRRINWKMCRWATENVLMPSIDVDTSLQYVVSWAWGLTAGNRIPAAEVMHILHMVGFSVTIVEVISTKISTDLFLNTIKHWSKLCRRYSHTTMSMSTGSRLQDSGKTAAQLIPWMNKLCLLIPPLTFLVLDKANWVKSIVSRKRSIQIWCWRIAWVPIKVYVVLRWPPSSWCKIELAR